MDIFIDSKFKLSSFSGGISSLVNSDFKEDLNFWNTKNKNIYKSHIKIVTHAFTHNQLLISNY